MHGHKKREEKKEKKPFLITMVYAYILKNLSL